jgi:hypothetical protein
MSILPHDARARARAAPAVKTIERKIHFRGNFTPSRSQIRTDTLASSGSCRRMVSGTEDVTPRSQGAVLGQIGGGRIPRHQFQALPETALGGCCIAMGQRLDARLQQVTGAASGGISPRAAHRSGLTLSRRPARAVAYLAPINRLAFSPKNDHFRPRPIAERHCEFPAGDWLPNRAFRSRV